MRQKVKQIGTLRRVILQKIFIITIYSFEEFPWWLSDKESAANAGDVTLSHQVNQVFNEPYQKGNLRSEESRLVGAVKKEKKKKTKKELIIRVNF